MEKRFAIRHLVFSDLNNGYLDLLSQLTIVGELSASRCSAIFSRIKKNPNHIVLVIIDKTHNKIVATGTLLVEDKFIHQGSSLAHIEDVVVDENYRKLGLGSTMIQALKDTAAQRGCYKVRAVCKEENVPFYTKQGFEKRQVEVCRLLPRRRRNSSLSQKNLEFLLKTGDQVLGD